MWPNLQFSADLFKFTEEILNGKLHFLCSVSYNFLNGNHCGRGQNLNLGPFRHLWWNIFAKIVNPFVPNAPFLYPLKTSENLAALWCFYGVEKRCIGNEWVNRLHESAFRLVYNDSFRLIYTDSKNLSFKDLWSEDKNVSIHQSKL